MVLSSQNWIYLKIQISMKIPSIQPTADDATVIVYWIHFNWMQYAVYMSADSALAPSLSHDSHGFKCGNMRRAHTLNESENAFDQMNNNNHNDKVKYANGH